MVIPRSFSKSISSSIYPPVTWMVLVNSSIRSAKVDFPWSMCAMMQKFLIWFIPEKEDLFLTAKLSILIGILVLTTIILPNNSYLCTKQKKRWEKYTSYYWVRLYLPYATKAWKNGRKEKPKSTRRSIVPRPLSTIHARIVWCFTPKLKPIITIVRL